MVLLSLQPLVTVYFHSIENKSSDFLRLNVTCLNDMRTILWKCFPEVLGLDHMIPPHYGNKTNSQVTKGQRFVSDIIRDLSVHIARQHLSVSIEMTTLSLDVDPRGHTLWREVSRGKAVCVI